MYKKILSSTSTSSSQSPSNPLASLFCNNCGKMGHTFNQCSLPITSIGIIAFRINPSTKQKELLMIRRKDTLGFVVFMRGKYVIYNRSYIKSMIDLMTMDEKRRLLKEDFKTLWNSVWNYSSLDLSGNPVSSSVSSTGSASSGSASMSKEENIARHKFEDLKKGVIYQNRTFTLQELINESPTRFEEAEWGFPKGRRNFQEKDLECALREFHEETGFPIERLHIVDNLLPFEEIFYGTNFKSYRQLYFLAYTEWTDDATKNIDVVVENSEVSKVEWKSVEDCLKCVRSYNSEKCDLILNISNTLDELGYSTY